VYGNPHEVSNGCERYYEGNVRRLFSEEELKQLELLAGEFREEFCLEEAVER